MLNLDAISNEHFLEKKESIFFCFKTYRINCIKIKRISKSY